jgi:hypothetical protein
MYACICAHVRGVYISVCARVIESFCANLAVSCLPAGLAIERYYMVAAVSRQCQ